MYLFMKNHNAFFFFFFFLFSFSQLFQPLFADVDSRITPPPDTSTQMIIIATATAATTSSSSTSLSNLSPPPSPPFPSPHYINTSPPIKPSIAVIVGVLTTMFSITLLLLLYAKHCKRSHIYNSFNDGNGRGVGGQASSEGRKNSGIDRAVIESLPIFRFSSLRGQKDGLECAVCLTKFEPPEVLRLLPKCKHAFHVECVDTWLDAHSTCPLCRYRVDPEDVLLIDQDIITRNILSPQEQQQDPRENNNNNNNNNNNTETSTTGSDISGVGRRFSGRHSSAGEKASGFDLSSQIGVQRPPSGGLSERVASQTASIFGRRSLDSFSSKKKSKNASSGSNESVAVRCFDRYQSHHHHRKDGLLLLTNNSDGDGDGDVGDHDHPNPNDNNNNNNNNNNRGSRRTSAASAGAGAGVEKARFEHRIIISGNGSGGYHNNQRWSDVHPSDLLYLRSEMIISDSRRLSITSGSRPSAGRRQQQNYDGVAVAVESEGGGSSSSGDGGRSVINGRSVSEITGLNRYSDRESYKSRHHRERQAGVVSRWLAWISSQSHPAVPSFRTTTTPTPSDAAAAV